ncbi:hypothetical protein COU54_05330 [Candidatus Pacearchaeota archaeon CG10_big_fil_rev_8_21_14_0_10_31_24]|nr:MAG: hypothetical protein COU54_05330 [Candidatus Pacearchaeota archaeon CG10_big_fil_rev_8_21_14_0_10_31_24]
MKNMLKSLGLASLLAIVGTGCSKDEVVKERTIEGYAFEKGFADFVHLHGSLRGENNRYNLHFVESTSNNDKLRAYPVATKSLPRAELKEFPKFPPV